MEGDQHQKVKEIKREVLDMKAANPPPKTISIRRSSGSTGYTESVESDSLEPSTRVDDAIPDAIPENGALNDSFYQKIESDKFYINTVNEEHQEENSFPSKVGGSQLDNELSHQELMNLVEQLYHNLKVSGSALKKEKSRRRSREKTIIKLAKELSNQKGIIRQQQGENDELAEEARVLQAEKSLVDQRLKNSLVDLHKAEGDIRKVYERQKEEQLAYKGLLHSNDGVTHSPRNLMPETSDGQGRRVLSLYSPVRSRRRNEKAKKDARRKALQAFVTVSIFAFAVGTSCGFTTANAENCLRTITEKLRTGRSTVPSSTRLPSPMPNEPNAGKTVPKSSESSKGRSDANPACPPKEKGVFRKFW